MKRAAPGAEAVSEEQATVKLWYIWWSGSRIRGRVIAMLIRARSEDRAREVAAEQSRPLGDYDWRNRELALAMPLAEEGDEEIIMEEVNR